MHWFWRAAIAVTIGVVFNTFLFAFGDAVLTPLQGIVGKFTLTLAMMSAMSCFPLLTYGILTRLYHPNTEFLDGDTRCRKCGYILRGISEPRCSECGEVI